MDGLSAPKSCCQQQIDRRLDLALTPGRFDKVIYLDLPAKRKRFELFKFYSQVRRRPNWDYFAKQTAGLSAAHISAAMNSSLLKVISENYFSDY
jgi:SpoVK/Ycf46/Vps4 family AAA+-type ATPase